MFLKIVFLVIGLVLIGIGAPMAEGNLNEKFNPYKIIVGSEIAVVGAVIATISFFTIFPALSPFN